MGLALQRFSGGLLMAQGGPPARCDTGSGSGCFLSRDAQLLCTLSYLILLDLRKFVLSSYPHFTDEKHKAQKGEGTSQRSQPAEAAQGLGGRTFDQALPLPLSGASGWQDAHLASSVEGV